MIHLFALLFGAGVVALLPLQNHRRIQPGFFRLVSALGLLAVLVALGSDPRPSVPLDMAAPPEVIAAPEPSRASASSNPRAIAATAALVAVAVLTAVYGGMAWTGRVERAGTAGWALLPAAAAAVGLEGWSLASGMAGASGAAASASSALSTASFLAGAGLLGSSTLALLLGHWYLYSPGLPVSHLRRLTTFIAVFVGARFLVFVAAAPGFAEAAPGGAAGGPGSGFDAAALLASNLPLAAMRFLLGILIPGILAWMIDRTVRIRSTQAATGLLYVSFIFVLFGEFIAAYLFVITGTPS